MISGRHRSRYGLALAMALMALSSLFPPGYMPVNTGRSLVIALCSSVGAKTVKLDLGGELPDHHTGSTCCVGALPVLPRLPEIIGLPALSYPAPPAILPPDWLVTTLFAAFDPNAPPQAPPFS